MASPKATGRMINRSISESEKIASLSPIAAALYMMLIPHYNAHGKMAAGPGVIKDEVVPLFTYLTYDNLPQYLQEISDKTNVKWFKDGSKWWLHSINFNNKHQHLDASRMGSDSLPSYQPPESEDSHGVVSDLPSRAEGFKVEGFKVKEELETQQQHANACEQLVEEVEKHQVELVRLFPLIDLPVATAKLLQHFRGRDKLVDPWMTALKWFQREFSHPSSLAGARASPTKTKGILREDQTREILAANAAACREFCQEGSDAG